MKLTRLLLLLALGFSFSVHAQDKCTIKIAEAPEIRGFKLGMGAEDIEKSLKGVSGIVNNSYTGKYGDAMVEFFPEMSKQSDERFNGIRKMKLEFLDKQITLIELEYGFDTHWNNADEFVAKVAAALKLPTIWRDPMNSLAPNQLPPVGGGLSRLNYDSDKRVLNCAGFDIEADVSMGAKLRLLNTSTKAILAERIKQAEESKKDTFKP